ncbi:unnamed protein product [Lasius platythorax]|uniref:Uncharacterized protein n=1 Tax=Lasius platythorax TaxID=488582 RepID=A0AAV2MY25_9HYME
MIPPALWSILVPVPCSAQGWTAWTLAFFEDLDVLEDLDDLSILKTLGFVKDLMVLEDPIVLKDLGDLVVLEDLSHGSSTSPCWYPVCQGLLLRTLLLSVL